MLGATPSGMRGRSGFGSATTVDSCAIRPARSGRAVSRDAWERVAITSGVSFMTHDGGVWGFRREHPDVDVFGPIVVGDNAFSGVGAILVPGVTIGSNSDRRRSGSS